MERLNVNINRYLDTFNELDREKLELSTRELEIGIEEWDIESKGLAEQFLQIVYLILDDQPFNAIIKIRHLRKNLMKKHLLIEGNNVEQFRN